MAADVVIRNSYTFATASGGTRGARPGAHVVEYDDRENACEALPVDPGTVPASLLGDRAPCALAGSPTGSGKACIFAPGDVARARAVATVGAAPREGCAFGFAPGIGRTLSAPAPWTRAAARMVQGFFEAGRTVALTVVSFSREFLLRVGAAVEGAAGRLAVDVARVRAAVMAAAEELCRPYRDPLAVCAVHTNTDHPHGHVSICEAAPEGSARATKGRHRKDRLKAARRAAAAALVRLREVLGPYTGPVAPLERVPENDCARQAEDVAAFVAATATSCGAPARAAVPDLLGKRAAADLSEAFPTDGADRFFVREDPGAAALAARAASEDAAGTVGEAAEGSFGPVLEGPGPKAAKDLVERAATAAELGRAATRCALRASRLMADPAAVPDDASEDRLHRLRRAARLAASAARRLGWFPEASEGPAREVAAGTPRPPAAPEGVLAERRADLGLADAAEDPAKDLARAEGLVSEVLQEDPKGPLAEEAEDLGKRCRKASALLAGGSPGPAGTAPADPDTATRGTAPADGAKGGPRKPSPKVPERGRTDRPATVAERPDGVPAEPSAEPAAKVRGRSAGAPQGPRSRARVVGDDGRGG